MGTDCRSTHKGLVVTQPKKPSRFAHEIPASISGPPVFQQKPGARKSKDEPVAIRVPRRGDDWWYGGWFTPPPETGELETSHAAVIEYHKEYHKMYKPDKHLPWRFSRSAATGLPSHLHGWLENPPGSGSEEAEAAAQRWLKHSLVVPMLIGREKWQEWEDRFPGSPETTESHWRTHPDVAQQDERGDINSSTAGTPDLNPGKLSADFGSAGEGSTTAPLHPEGQTPPEGASFLPVVKRRFHVWYQQWHGEWPVFGSQVGVHMVEEDERLACISSYLPVSKEPEAFAPPHISDAEACRIARRALAHYLEDTPYLTEPPALDTWMTWVQEHAGSDKVVLPFAGDLCLAYQVRVKPSALSVTWRVFVDAQTGEVLGRPHPLALLNWVFGNSADALDDTPSLSVPLPENPCRDYMDVSIVSEVSGSEAPPVWGLSPHQPPDLGNDPQVLQFEAFNIAFHTSEFHKYLQDICGAAPESLRAPEGDPKRLRAKLNEAGTGRLDTFFDLGTGEIVFQHDDGTGLVSEGALLVHHPARDPEVIYHEMAHALMWLVNKDPFEALADFPPVARAILEGYANYFARSCAASRSHESPPNAHWAAAAYRTEPSAWGDRWALFRKMRIPGQDVLPVPELYPFSETRFNLDDYDVGMIWARALWDLRQLVGPAIAERLAWNAFTSVHGRITSFEPIVESLLDLADLLEGAEENRIHWGNVLLPILAGRRLLSERGVQALAAGGGIILAGTSEGAWRSHDGGNTWTGWGQLGAGETLQDVVALAVHEGNGETVFYAATYTRTTTSGTGMEAGIYRRIPTDSHWTPVGTWTQALRPLSLTVAADGDLYAGTGQGVWRFSTGEATPEWQSHNPSAAFGRLFHGLALDIAFRLPEAGTSTLCVAGFNGLWWRLPGNNQDWRAEELQNEATDIATSVAADGADVFVGTVRAGIWQGTFDDNGRFNRHVKKQIASPAQLDQAAVLSLVATEEATLTLYAGTTAGVFRGQPTNNENWVRNPLTGLPTDADVLSLLATASGRVFAGTAIHGLWQWDGVTWSQATGVPALIPPVDNSFPIPPFSSNTLISFAPFYLPQAQPISVTIALPSDAAQAELWKLSPGVDLIASSEDGNIPAVNQQPGFYAIAIRRKVS